MIESVNNCKEGIHALLNANFFARPWTQKGDRRGDTKSGSKNRLCDAQGFVNKGRNEVDMILESSIFGRFLWWLWSWCSRTGVEGNIGKKWGLFGAKIVDLKTQSARVSPHWVWLGRVVHGKWTGTLRRWVGCGVFARLSGQICFCPFSLCGRHRNRASKNSVIQISRPSPVGVAPEALHDEASLWTSLSACC